MEAWTNSEVERCLKVCAVSETQAAALGYTYQEEFQRLYTVDDIDTALLTVLTETGVQQPLMYLAESYDRVQQSMRLLSARDAFKPQKEEVLLELQRLIVGYGLVALQVEEFCVGNDHKSSVEGLVSGIDTVGSFLGHVIQRSIEEETVLELLNAVFPVVAALETDMNSSYSKVLSLFQLFLSFKPVAAVFSQVDGFHIEYGTPANEFEKRTVMGRILAISPLQTAVSAANYTNVATHQMQNVHESLQLEHRVVVDRLFQIVDKIVRGSEQSRADLLQYFGTIVNQNHLRRGDHADFNKLTSNALMTNIALVLIRLSQPFLDVSYKKIDKIDVDYFNNLNLVLDLSNETRMNSDYAEADKFYDANKKDSTTNFISDCFFLTLTYLHYGIGGDILYDSKLRQQMEQVESQLERLRAHQGSEFERRMAQMQLQRVEKMSQTIKCQKEASSGFFTNRQLQNEIFEFVAGASTFLMRVIDPKHLYPFHQLELPLIPDMVGLENIDNAEYLRSQAPIPFKYYPELVVEGLVNYVDHIVKFMGTPLYKHPRLHSFAELATTVLRCPELVSNPHLKVKLTGVLFYCSVVPENMQESLLADVYSNNDLVLNHLLYGLLDFYVSVEKTGSSSQFYDKFNARYNISSVLRELYKIPQYKQRLLKQSQETTFFTRFVARMLNDLTFLLDEGLQQLTDVHNLQSELKRRSRGEQPHSEDSIEDIQRKLSSAERQARSNIGLANKSIELFSLFTADIPQTFTGSEVVDRLASMLDYNLKSLVGPKCAELKVTDPSKYNFSAIDLLEDLVKVFVNLSEQQLFIGAVARDERSFEPELFETAISILAKKHRGSEKLLLAFREFKNAALQQRLDDEAEEEELGDVPEEFLDPLMYTIMQDPVILPSSRVSIDRSTIKAHLLSDSTDPFNRMPLKLEDVIDDVELKEKITQFRAERRK